MAQAKVNPEITNPTCNVGFPDVAAGNPACIGGSSNDAAGQDARVVDDGNGVDAEAKDSELTRLLKEREAGTHENVRFDSDASELEDIDWSMLNVWDFSTLMTTISMQRPFCQRS